MISQVGRSLLLVEDDVGNALTLSALLEDCGFRVDIAASLAEARGQMKTQRYALILLDNRLRDGAGHELIPELRQHLPKAPIVLVCGERPRRLPEMKRNSRRPISRSF